MKGSRVLILQWIIQQIYIQIHPVDEGRSVMNKNNAIYVGNNSDGARLSIHSYAESCELYQIFAEVTRVVARKSNMNVNQALTEYLSQCNKGEHVVLKSYSSFSKSIVNRQCFLYNFCKIFETQTNVRNGLDYYQLFRLLCSDFPKDVILNAVRIVEGDHEKMMEVLVNSEKFLNALYIAFIYAEYFEAMLQKVFKAKHEQEVSLLEVFQWIRVENQKNVHALEKPSIDILYQILLNHLSARNAVKMRGISFVNQSTISDFILNCVGENKNSVTISYAKLLSNLADNKRHQKMVDRYIFNFDNSGNWANEASKLLNVREQENPTPLNSKKMKKK